MENTIMEPTEIENENLVDNNNCLLCDRPTPADTNPDTLYICTPCATDRTRLHNEDMQKLKVAYVSATWDTEDAEIIDSILAGDIVTIPPKWQVTKMIEKDGILEPQYKHMQDKYPENAYCSMTWVKPDDTVVLPEPEEIEGIMYQCNGYEKLPSTVQLQNETEKTFAFETLPETPILYIYTPSIANNNNYEIPEPEPENFHYGYTGDAGDNSTIESIDNCDDTFDFPNF